ncbi:MAG: SAM-dependent methyltransferase [Marivirga sp.]|nr:SAM-dependent methyltransferase [Marivirga sp.]
MGMRPRDQLLNNPSLVLENDVFYQKEINRGSNFEKEYIRLRQKEGRVYSDEIAKHLPIIAADHVLKKEWMSRRLSLNKLVVHLKSTGSGKSILELGCGNGWLAHALAISLEGEVCAMDINETELLQGSRVFASARNLNFLYGDIFTVNVGELLFDTIILASSVQYFSDVKKLMNRLLQLLKLSGEIHILDSPFYSSFSEAEKARSRTIVYFESLGFPEMANRYFHHTLQVMKDFNHELVFNPHSFVNKISQRISSTTGSPFPWIIIRHA